MQVKFRDDFVGLTSLSIVLSHKLQLIIGWPTDLGKTQASFNTLQELSRTLVTHDMSFPCATFVKLLSSRTFVDTNHGDTDRPSTVAKRQD